MALLVVRKEAFGQALHLGRDFLWMTPVATGLLLLMAGGLTALVVWVIRGSWARIAAIGALVGLSWVSVLAAQPWLHRWAALVLAAGLTIQTTRWVVGRPRSLVSAARRVVGASLVLLLLLAGGVRGSEYLRERQAYAGGGAAPQGAKNVLLIIWDTVRARSLGLYGYGRETSPVLDDLADRGVTFDRAVVPAPWTLPSHASIFTGVRPDRLTVGWFTALDDSEPTLAEVMTARGYRTVGVVANTIYASHEWGLDRGFARYHDFTVSPGELFLSSGLGRLIANSERLRVLIGYHNVPGRRYADDINRDFLAWLDDQPGDAPFFAFLNLFDAHEPYLPPAPFDSVFGPQPQYRTTLRHRTNSAEVAGKWKLSPEEVDRYVNAYDGSIANLDHHLGRLLDELERRGVLDETVVVVTSDHGEEFGEHGVFSHGFSLYQPGIRVPLVIVDPDSPGGRRITEPVGLIDLPATLLSLSDAGAGPLPGESFADLVTGSAAPSGEGRPAVVTQVERSLGAPEWYPGSKGDLTSLTVGRHQFIRVGDAGAELYDLVADPDQHHDLLQSGDEDLLRYWNERLDSVWHSGYSPASSGGR